MAGTAQIMYRNRLIESIVDHEGYRELPYKDSVGKWTVGFGHLIDDLPLRNYVPDRTVGAFLRRITDPDTHQKWLLDDVDVAIHDAKKWLGEDFKTMTDARQEVVAEISFQLGLPRLSTFVKMKAAILARDWDLATHELRDSKLARQAPGRILSLSDRFAAG